MAMPVAGTKLGPTLHLNLHNIHDNVKAYGATGDGATDDRAAIQAAIDAAGVTGGSGHVLFPAGNYKINGALSLDTAQSVRLSGSAGVSSDPSPGTWNKSGVRIFGTLSGPLIQRTDDTPGGEHQVLIEDMGLDNLHATGTCISLAGIITPCGVRRVHMRGHIGIVFGNNCFNQTIQDCTFQLAGTTLAGSRGIEGSANCYHLDINGYERGINSPGGLNLYGARIEVCQTGLYLGGGGFSASGILTGFSMEANDTGIRISSGADLLINGVGINGHSGSPAGGSQVGIDVYESNQVTIMNTAESGTHTTAFIRQNGVGSHHGLTFLSCRSTTAWSLSDGAELFILNCTGTTFASFIGQQITFNEGSKSGSGKYHEFVENGTTDAAAGAVDTGRLYVRDNGAGKTQLCVRFNTGAVQVIATQP